MFSHSANLPLQQSGYMTAPQATAISQHTMAAPTTASNRYATSAANSHGGSFPSPAMPHATSQYMPSQQPNGPPNPEYNSFTDACTSPVAGAGVGADEAYEAFEDSQAD